MLCAFFAVQVSNSIIVYPEVHGGEKARPLERPVDHGVGEGK